MIFLIKGIKNSTKLLLFYEKLCKQERFFYKNHEYSKINNNFATYYKVNNVFLIKKLLITKL